MKKRWVIVFFLIINIISFGDLSYTDIIIGDFAPSNNWGTEYSKGRYRVKKDFKLPKRNSGATGVNNIVIPGGYEKYTFTDSDRSFEATLTIRNIEYSGIDGNEFEFTLSADVTYEVLTDQDINSVDYTSTEGNTYYYYMKDESGNDLILNGQEGLIKFTYDEIGGIQGVEVPYYNSIEFDGEIYTKDLRVSIVFAIAVNLRKPELTIETLESLDVGTIVAGEAFDSEAANGTPHNGEIKITGAHEAYIEIEMLNSDNNDINKVTLTNESDGTQNVDIDLILKAHSEGVIQESGELSERSGIYEDFIINCTSMEDSYLEAIGEMRYQISGSSSGTATENLGMGIYSGVIDVNVRYEDYQ